LGDHSRRRGRRHRFPAPQSARCGSTLALFVARIGTDDVHHSAAADDLAMFTDTLDAGTNFHGGITAGTWNLDKRLNIALAPGCGQAPSVQWSVASGQWSVVSGGSAQVGLSCWGGPEHKWELKRVLEGARTVGETDSSQPVMKSGFTAADTPHKVYAQLFAHRSRFVTGKARGVAASWLAVASGRGAYATVVSERSGEWAVVMEKQIVKEQISGPRSVDREQPNFFTARHCTVRAC